MQDTATPGTGDFLRLARTRAGLSQRTLSLAVGRSPAYVSKVEAGLIEPSFQSVSLLVAALRLTPLELWVLAMVSARDGQTTLRVSTTVSDFDQKEAS